jgi:hypothetical protein
MKKTYEILLDELAAAIQEKNDTIAFQKWQIADLQNKLAIAEEYKKINA